MVKDIIIAQKQELDNKLKEPYIERKADLKKLENPLIKVIVSLSRIKLPSPQCKRLYPKGYTFLRFNQIERFINLMLCIL